MKSTELVAGAPLIVGLDPGGIGQFGWCVAVLEAGSQAKVLKTGISDSAFDAIGRIADHVGDLGRIAAAGIDSPLFWASRGDRRVDIVLREAMRRRGARNVHGTVQAVNSLRGACVAQGVLAAHLLRQSAPAIRLTESHPKALLWLLSVASPDHSVASRGLTHCKEFLDSDTNNDVSEHERDAALGVVSAAAMVRSDPRWQNFAADIDDAFVPVAPVEYWLPLDAGPLAGGNMGVQSTF